MTKDSNQLEEEKVFKDPIHRYIHVHDQTIWELIGTKEFQRLRRIRQLGTTYLTFHGAEHSRFSHSLGVYEIVRRIIDVFEGQPDWDPEERLIAMAAALLHDVGHGPFSHTFEKVFHMDHEDWTRKIILGETEVNKVLKKVAKDFPRKVAEVIEKTYENKLVVSMISSQIDADRMDYLLRDAYYTGVSYGHFDIERIWRVMRPMNNQVVIKRSGMHAVEDYIMSRYQMYWQVYFHPVTRSAEVILSNILSRAKKLFEEDYDFNERPTRLLPFFKGQASLEDYLSLDESVILYYFQSWQDEQDEILKSLCDRFMNRRLFKYVDYTLNSDEDYQQLQQWFREAEIDPDYFLVCDSSSDSPYDLYSPGGEEELMPIHLLTSDGTLSELSQESDVVEAISGKKRSDHKLYYPEEPLHDFSKHAEVKKKILACLSANPRNSSK